MIDAITAEALKFRRHRATWLMVWIYPLALALLIAAQLLRDLDPGGIKIANPVTAELWLRQTTLVWSAPLSGPGRFMIAGFAALMFAGEYGWNTWKLIIPARPRWQLLAAKWIVCAAFMLVAFAVADCLMLLGSLLRPLVGGPAVPNGVAFASIAASHFEAAGHGVLPILYTIAWAGLFGVLTTSVLATVVLSIVVIVLEQLLLVIAVIAHGYAPTLTYLLLKSLPFFHMANVISWAKGMAYNMPLGTGANLSASWSTSILVVLAWVCVLAVTTQIRFLRQDLN